MWIDLHTHSTASDGTDSPSALVSAAARAGLDVIAITDHDTADGWAQALEAGERCGVRVVPGIEVSCRHRGGSLHLLGYLLDPTAPELMLQLQASRTSREGRAKAMVERLATDYPIEWQDVLDQRAPGGTIGRPHIADALVARGVFAHRDEAFATVLHVRSPYHVGHYAPSPVQAVRAVVAAGGVAVLAHPLAARQRRPADDELIEHLADVGLAGIEVDHRDHDAESRHKLQRTAHRLGLMVTGGSDYHGTGKRNVIGENRTCAAVLEQIEGLAGS